MALPITGVFGCEDLVIVTDYSSVDVAELCNHYVFRLDPEDVEPAEPGIGDAGVHLAVESPEEHKVDGVGSVGSIHEGEDHNPPQHPEIGHLLLDGVLPNGENLSPKSVVMKAKPSVDQNSFGTKSKIQEPQCCICGKLFRSAKLHNVHVYQAHPQVKG